MKSRLDAILWQEDRFQIDDVVYRMDQLAEYDRSQDQECFWIFKGPPIFADYRAFFETLPEGSEFKNVLELGIWETGSLAFWNQVLQPRKHVGLDLSHSKETAYFRRYVQSRGLRDRLKTYWQTNQADAQRLVQIIRKEFDGPLDMVIDDASHMLEPTRASFVTIFPLVREGGLYFIEDWRWALHEFFTATFPPGEPGLLGFVDELTDLFKEEPDLVSGLDVKDSFVALTRGPMPETAARALLTARMPARFEKSPSLLRRHARNSRIWTSLRGLAGRPTAH
jgi:hypothetical protein